MATRAYLWHKALAGLLFPQRRCLNCATLSVGMALCPHCLATLRQLRVCPRCASFIAVTETADYLCTDCRSREQPFVLARAALPYRGELRRQLLAFKYRDRAGLRRSLSSVLLAAYQHYYSDFFFDAVVPVPLSTQRLESRGYNQVELLSALLSAELELPHHPEYLQRVRDTQRLYQMSRAERTRVLQNAFLACSVVEKQRILLVDDIYTTGATARAASTALLKQGATSVCVLCVAASYELSDDVQVE